MRDQGSRQHPCDPWLPSACVGRSIAPTLRIMRRLRFLLALAALLVATRSFADDAAPSWPQTFTQDGNTLLIYVPQLDTWANRLDFTGRVAATVTPAGGTATSG